MSLYYGQLSNWMINGAIYETCLTKENKNDNNKNSNDNNDDDYNDYDINNKNRRFSDLNEKNDFIQLFESHMQPRNHTHTETTRSIW